LTSQSINHIICRRADGHSTKQVHGHWAAATCGALPVIIDYRLSQNEAFLLVRCSLFNNTCRMERWSLRKSIYFWRRYPRRTGFFTFEFPV